MTVVNSCKSNNIFYNDPGALQITNRLCACSAVRSLLASFENPIPIHVRTGSYPGIRFEIFPSGDKAEIQIPRQMLNSQVALQGFVFEIFNVKNQEKIKALQDRASKGDVDMNVYAKDFETIEFESKLGALDIAEQCGLLDGKETITKDLEIHLWNKEFDCHTDKIRERWIESYQKLYCEKNPKKKSCKTKPEDLCDYYVMKNLPKDLEWRERVIRICERLPELPQKVKDYWPTAVRSCLRAKKDL